MKLTDILGRAKFAAANSKARYHLGAGGMHPDAPLPENADKQCDCSGFVSWCIGEKRQTTNEFYVNENGGWVETTAVCKDAEKGGGLFTKVETPQPGDIIVWPDGGGHQGHIGIVSEVADGKAAKVIHCSKGNDNKYNLAIHETDADIFHDHDAKTVRFDKAEI